MKKTILFTIIIIGLNSCVTLNLQENVPIGKYNIKDDLYYEELELKPNGTFNLKIQLGHTKENCQGEWVVKSKNELILNGLDTRKFTGIDSLYYEKINCKNLLIKFENKNKIKRKNYYLKKM